MVNDWIRYECCSEDTETISDMFSAADQSLFKRALNNEQHALQSLLPDKTNFRYNLRPRRHSRQLTRKSACVSDSCFITRMLYLNSDCWLRWCWSRLEVCRSEAVFLEFLWLYFNTMFVVYHTFATITHGYGGLSCRPLRCGLPGRCALSAPTAWQCLLPDCRLLAAELYLVGSQIWNNLPEDVTSADSLSTFRRLLKTHLFRNFFPDYMLDINWLSLMDLEVVPLLRPP